MDRDTIESIALTRARKPGALAEPAAARRRPAGALDASGSTLIVAADHPARGSLAAGPRPLAMADRGDLLDRLCVALSRPGVSGVLGTPDIVEDLLLLGALHDKVVFGSMNRGGLSGASWEIDDRFTAYDAATIAAMGYQGGKMLTRIAFDEAATAGTLEASARAVSDLAAHGLVAMVEPFISRRVDGRVRNDLSTEAAIRASAIAAGLGTTSAYTWLKVPVVDDMERVVAASTLPTVLLGGEVGDDQDAMFEAWHSALRLPNVVGLVVGRSLLYPPGDDVAAAVEGAVGVLPRAAPLSGGSAAGR
jgi:hypothetical protein